MANLKSFDKGEGGGWFSDRRGDWEERTDSERADWEGRTDLEMEQVLELQRALDAARTLKKIRRWIVFFVVALVLSGVTAFALETEMRWLVEDWPLSKAGPLFGWVERVYSALRDSGARYPFLAYGYDWLAFAHLVIAVVFIGPFRDPVRNKWVVEFGMIACVMVFPLAIFAGAVRGIPIYWRLIDCSFGVVGLVPLSICYKAIGVLERTTER